MKECSIFENCCFQVSYYGWGKTVNHIREEYFNLQCLEAEREDAIDLGYGFSWLDEGEKSPS
jgi:hypothetical protein